MSDEERTACISNIVSLIGEMSFGAHMEEPFMLKWEMEKDPPEERIYNPRFLKAYCKYVADSLEKSLPEYRRHQRAEQRIADLEAEILMLKEKISSVMDEKSLARTPY